MMVDGELLIGGAHSQSISRKTGERLGSEESTHFSSLSRAQRGDPGLIAPLLDGRAPLAKARKNAGEPHERINCD